MVNTARFILLILLLSLAASGPGKSQTFEWKAGFFGFFDNREYFNPYIIPQTIFGENLTAEAGFSINPENRFMTGLSYTFENGSKEGGFHPDPILYFRGDWKPATFIIGAFPRYQLFSQPLAMLTDTLLYYRPNVEGMFLEFRRDWGYHNIWIDWTSRQTDVINEEFLLGATGMIRKGIFFYRHHFLMAHFAGPGIDTANHHLRDNGGVNVMPGLDLGKILPFDTAIISTGFLMSYDRVRSVYDMQFMWGWLTDLNVQYKGFGLHGIYYRGDGQQFAYGDGFYKSGNYGRTDLYFTKSYRSHITGRLEFSMHFLPGIVDLSYTIHLRASLGGGIKLRQIN
jgi:hypothetical protein